MAAAVEQLTEHRLSDAAGEPTESSCRAQLCKEKLESTNDVTVTKSDVSPTDDAKKEGDDAGKKAGSGGAAKTKIFDNKNFVEAPLPRTNAWKSGSAEPAKPAVVPPNVSVPTHPLSLAGNHPGLFNKYNTILSELNSQLIKMLTNKDSIILKSRPSVIEVIAYKCKFVNFEFFFRFCIIC